MPEIVKVCHDRILPHELFRPQRTRHTNGALRAVLEFRKMWINGSTLRVRFMGGTPVQQALVQEEALWWTEHANLTFDFNNAPKAEIRIAFDPEDGAWSWVGTDCRSIPLDQPTMNLGFLDGGTAAHEFGHAIGLGHEHQNPAGGIQWNEAIVIRALGGPPNFWSPEEVRDNVLEKYAVDQIRGTTFDPDSIMLYAYPANWTRNGIGTEANKVLSAGDKAFIASEEAYPPTVADAVELGVNATGTSAEIAVPGQENLFTFTPMVGGRHVIETEGQTNVMLKLFGPNSQTLPIAGDDDGGVGLNARLVANLLPGRYFVQVRHFSRERGTGKYTIRVRT